MRRTPLSAGRRAVIAAVLPALALAACNKPAAQTADTGAVANSVAPLAALPATVPMTNDLSATPLASAPAATALPDAPIPRVVRVADPRQSYAYADRAAAMSGAVDGSPPDYAFDYGGVQPWAWRAGDGSTEVVEPVGGGYRYYYYEPGASRPYLVRDPDHAYAYDDGDLAAVYGPDGRYLPPEAYRGRYADYAGRYLVRGAALIAAAAAVAHYGVPAGHWRAHRAGLAAEHARWQEDRQRQADWRAYHDAHAASERDHWNGEEAARDDRAERFDQWQRSDYRGPPPGSPGADHGRHASMPDDGQRQDRIASDQRRTGGPGPNDARPPQSMHDEQQRQIAERRAVADGRTGTDRQTERLQRDDAQREAGSTDRRQPAWHDDDARMQWAVDRQQAAAQRQHAADQRQEVADQHRRAAIERQQSADERQQSVEKAGFGRGDRNDPHEWRTARRDREAPTRDVQADDQRPSPSARLAMGAGSMRPVPIGQQRERGDATPARVPHAQSESPPRPVAVPDEPRAHAAAAVHLPSLDPRASAHTEAGQEHGNSHHGH